METKDKVVIQKSEKIDFIYLLIEKQTLKQRLFTRDKRKTLNNDTPTEGYNNYKIYRPNSEGPKYIK